MMESFLAKNNDITMIKLELIYFGYSVIILSCLKMGK